MLSIAVKFASPLLGIKLAIYINQCQWRSVCNMCWYHLKDQCSDGTFFLQGIVPATCYFFRGQCPCYIFFCRDRNKLRFCAINIRYLFFFFSQNNNFVNVKMRFASEKICFLTKNYIFRNKKNNHIVYFGAKIKAVHPDAHKKFPCNHFFARDSFLETFFFPDNCHRYILFSREIPLFCRDGQTLSKTHFYLSIHYQDNKIFQVSKVNMSPQKIQQGNFLLEKMVFPFDEYKRYKM